jgi:hypothetical protein
VSFILKLLAGSAGPYIAGAVGAALLGLSGAVWLLSGQLGSAHKALAVSDAYGKAEHGAFLSERDTNGKLIAARSFDHTDAVTDANTTQTTCQARVDTARKSATAITALLNKVPSHATPDPVEPELLTAGQLRSAQGR